MSGIYGDGVPIEVIALREVKEELEKIREGARYTKIISILALLVAVASFLFNFII